MGGQGRVNMKISFEETLKRHQTRSNRYEFGEEVMKSWWVDKDYSEILNEAMITESKSKEEIAQEILHDIQNK